MLLLVALFQVAEAVFELLILLLQSAVNISVCHHTWLMHFFFFLQSMNSLDAYCLSNALLYMCKI